MKYGCIGEKLSHSFSKEIHNMLAEYEYELREIAPQDLDEFIKNKDFSGINVTIPYKEKVIPFLDYVSEQAKEIGAVNTIVRKGDKLYGYNTDFYGLKGLIVRNNIDIYQKKVLILGTGGTSKTAYEVVRNLGASEIFKVSRNRKDGAISYEDAYAEHLDAEIIINTTPVGMFPNVNTAPINIEKFSSLAGVIDAVYNPRNTCLVSEARNRGIKACSGLYMLVYQAAVAAGLFLDKTLSDDVIETVYKKIAASKLNIVLIGMPSSGKTTIGRKLSDRLGKKFVDTDSEIERKAKCKVSDIFAQKGEKEFREMESDIIKEISALQGQVIATGGGSVLDKTNVEHLKKNGIIIYLERDLSRLIATDTRPLSNSKEAMERLYHERSGIYEASSDIIFNANVSSDEATASLERMIKYEITCD